MADDQLLSTTMTPDGILTTRQVATDVRQKELYIILTVAVPSSDDTKVIYPKSIIFNGEAQLYMSEVYESTDVLFYHALQVSRSVMQLEKGDKVIITGGIINGRSGNTNTIKVGYA